MTPQRLLRPALILILLAIWLGVSAVGGRQIGQISTVTTNNQEVLLPRSAESVTAREVLKRFDDTDTLPALVVLQSPDQVARAFPAVRTDGRPAGPPGAQYARDLLAPIQVAGQPIAALYAQDASPVVVRAGDDSGVLVIVPLSKEKLEARDAAGKNLIQPTAQALRDRAQQAAPGAEVHVTGPVGFVADTSAAFAGIDGLLLLVALAAVLIILLIVYRSLVLPLLVLSSSVAGLSLAGWVVYRLAASGTIVINGQAQGILFILVVGAATDYGLLLVARFREELTGEESTVRALWSAWKACLEPVAASAGTVALGLLCLFVAELNSSRYLGPVGVIAVAAALLSAMTFLPALLLLGRWVFWPRIPRPAKDSATTGVRPGLWSALSHRVAAHPRRVWLGAAAVLLIGAVFAPTLQASGTTQSQIFLTRQDSVVGQQVLDEHYDLGATQPVRVVLPETVAQTAEQRLRELSGVEGVRVGTVAVEGRVVLDVAVDHPADAQQTVASIREVTHRLAPGQVLVGGDQAERLDTNQTAQRDLQKVIPLVLLVVLLVLTWLLRSFVGALLLTLANVLSFATTMGVAALVFNHLLGFPGADPTVPLLGFVFLVALGVDYSIFLMSRAREEVARHGPTEGVRLALAGTGGVITSAGIVLAATFAALAVIPLLFLAQLAFIVAFGVLLDTFIVRSLLVPGLAIHLGRWAWWPSRLSARNRVDEPGGGAAYS